MIESEKSKVVVGIYKTKAIADYAREALKIEGFEAANVSVVTPGSFYSQEIAHDPGSKIPEDLMIGAGTGAMVGGILGFFIGLGAMAIPGVGPFVAGGPIMATLAGAAFGSAFGGVAGALIGIGFPGYESGRFGSSAYGSATSRGIMLRVQTKNSEESAKAKGCLERAGAEVVILKDDSKEEWKSLKQKYKKRIRNSEIKVY